MQKPVRLKKRFIDSLVSSYFIQGLTSGSNFLLKIGLAWLIVPEDFGLFAVALLILSIVNVVRDFGLGTQTIRDPDPAYGSIFWFHIFSGMICWAAVWFGAGLTVWLNPELPGIIRMFSPVIIFSSLTSIPLLYFNRTLQLRQTVVPRLMQLFTYVVLAVGLAFAGRGMIALVIGKVASEAVLAIVLWLRFRGRVSLRPGWSSLARMLWQARVLYVLGLIEMLVIDIDKGVLSKNCSEDIVGLYFLGWSVVFFLSKIIEPSFNRVLFPAFARMRNDPERLSILYTWGTVAIMIIEVPCYMALAFFAKDVIGLMFPPSYQEMAPWVALLAFLPIIDPFSMLGIEVLRSQHKDAFIFVPSILALLVLIFGGNYLTVKYGAPGMVLANFIVHIGSIGCVWKIRKMLYTGYCQLLQYLVPIYGITLTISIAMHYGAGISRSLNLFLACGMIVASWLVLAVVFFRPLRRSVALLEFGK